MSSQIEENVTKILRSQNCKKLIESSLIIKRVKTGRQVFNGDRIQLNCMLFHVVKDSIVTDHQTYFPCKFELGQNSIVPVDQRKQTEVPRSGSFIRTIKMDFDMKNHRLVIYDYQYLGGANSITPVNLPKANWNAETVAQIVRKNNTVKGGQILLDAYANEKTVTQPFQYPKVKLLTVKLLQQVLAKPQQQLIDHKVEKISIVKHEIAQSDYSQSNNQKINQQQF